MRRRGSRGIRAKRKVKRPKRSGRLAPKFKFEEKHPVVSSRKFQVPHLAQLAPHKWVLLRKYKAPAHREGYPELEIQPGLIFDGASIPRVAWSYHHPFGSPLISGLIHDARYYFHDVDREFADDEFYWNLVATGHSEIDAWVMWRAVRMGGAYFWKTGEKDLKAKKRVIDPEILKSEMRRLKRLGWSSG